MNLGDLFLRVVGSLYHTDIPSRTVGLAAAAAVCIGLVPAQSAQAADLEMLRTKLQQQGYLRFRQSVNGEESTGWIDTRHPGNDGTFINNLTSIDFGYDRNDSIVTVANKIVTADQGGGIDATANPNIARDYTFANEIWAQAGITVLSSGVQANVDLSVGNPQGNPVVTLPAASGAAGQDPIRATARTPGNVINNYYVTSGVDNTNQALRGVAYDPTTFGNHAIMVFDSAASDTFAHEVGHFLNQGFVFNNPGDGAHSPNNTDYLANGAIRQLPAGNSEWNFLDPAIFQNGDPSSPNLGTRSRMAALMSPDGVQPFTIDQRVAAHASPFVVRTDNSNTAGDRADFDFVADNKTFEALGGPLDNHVGADALIFEIDAITPYTALPGRVKPADRYKESAYANGTFNTVDVISLFARYGDNRSVPGEKQAIRANTLDYATPEFSSDGVNWFAGTLLNVFTKGWTNETSVENFTARWLSPIDATMVRINAATGVGEDSNTQIDAVIAGRTGPLPLTLGPVSPGPDPGPNPGKSIILNAPGSSMGGHYFDTNLTLIGNRTDGGSGGDLGLTGRSIADGTSLLTIAMNDASGSNPLASLLSFDFDLDFDLLSLALSEFSQIDLFTGGFTAQWATEINGVIEYWQLDARLTEGLDAVFSNVLLTDDVTRGGLAAFDLTFDLLLGPGASLTDPQSLFTFSLAMAHAVPEPGVLVTLSGGLVALVRRRRDR